MLITPLPHPVPLQPPNVEPATGVAVNVTTVALVKEAEQVLPQLMPPGLLVTVPFPVPLLFVVFTKLTVSMNWVGVGVVTDGVVPQTSSEFGETPASLKAFAR
jgi:hypothetical protein